MDHELVALATRLIPDPYGRAPHRTVGILDANAILSSVDNDCRNGWDSRVLRSTGSGSTTLYAADHVWSEVYEHLPRMAAHSGIPVEQLRERFETAYLPAIRFVTMSVEDEPHSRVLEITDRDDRPTGLLALLIAPVIVYSEDKHLRRPGFAPPNWRVTAGHTADVAEAVGQERATAVVLSLPILGVWSGSGAVGRRLGVAPWLPGAVLLTVVAVGAHRLLRDPARRASAKDVAGTILERILEPLLEQSRMKVVALAGIAEVIFADSLERPTVRQQVATVLARSPEPLLAREVHALVAEHLRAELVPSLREVRSTLADGAEFVSVDRNRWQLGRDPGPWPGQYI